MWNHFCNLHFNDFTWNNIYRDCILNFPHGNIVYHRELKHHWHHLVQACFRYCWSFATKLININQKIISFSLAFWNQFIFCIPLAQHCLSSPFKIYLRFTAIEPYHKSNNLSESFCKHNNGGKDSGFYNLKLKTQSIPTSLCHGAGNPIAWQG